MKKDDQKSMRQFRYLYAFKDNLFRSMFWAQEWHSGRFIKN